MNNKIVFGIGGIIIGLVLAIFFTTAMSPYRNGGFGMMGWKSNSGSNQGLTGNAQVANNIDRHFIEQMIPHHDGANARSRN